MNTNLLKKFAQEARKKLLEQVGAKLSFVLTTDSVELREKADQVSQLREELSRTGKAQLIEKVAYTWFNRLVALRFMDANDYQPLGIRIITPKEGYTTPELLDEAKRGNIPDELKLKRQKVYDLLDNRIPSTNPQNEAYKELLIAACNHLNTVFPFLFEKISDYTELLIPDDLTSDFSIVTDVREGMPLEDCANVEIIGWLYQFYISEENARLIESKNVYTKYELAPASQLFTPKWIVQYMVDNTLGQIITEFFPQSQITKQLDFYIKPAYIDQIPKRAAKKIEDIKFFDPCVGSAHVLSYAFDVFYMIYKEQGYSESEIPALIIKHNLFGTDIDERSAQLSSFVLMMKGLKFYRRFLKKDIRPNITSFRDFGFDVKFKNASVLGSLIKVEPSEGKGITVDKDSIFAEQQGGLNQLYNILGSQYDVVVTNPPYINSSRMEGSLKQYVESNYPDTKYDLFSTFILRCLELCTEDGVVGYMTPMVWMFIASFEKLRRIILENNFINNLVQLEYSGFDGATVPICTFTLRKTKIHGALGSYIRLSDFRGANIQGQKTLEAIRNNKCNWFFNIDQDEFKKIPRSPIGYWLSEKTREAFQSTSISDNFIAKAGIVTGNDNKLVRLWHEISFEKISFYEEEYHESEDITWVPINSGGSFRKYYGNNEYIININKLWRQGETTKSVRRGNRDYYYKPSISWSMVTSSKSSFRFSRNKTFMNASPAIYSDKLNDLYFVLGFLNSKVVEVMLPAINPTLNVLTGDVLSLPNIISQETSVIELVSTQIFLSNEEWDSKEISSDFNNNELNRIKGQDLEEVYELYQKYWEKKILMLKKNDEQINQYFIKIYGLEQELTSEIPLDAISVLKEETDVKNGKLVFHSDEVFSQFISYAVGCMFGRYSLDKEGLVLANQGETLHNYLQKIEKTLNECNFLPDEDNIIPVLDNEWFEDDIAGRFYQFLKVSFGEANFSKNLAFVEEQLGKDIRKYFTKDFYPDHIKRYKKRPIYWMFSSPKGSFNVLIYLHRYTPDTVSNILNKYLKEFIGKLKTRKETLQHLQVNGSASEKIKAIKENDSIDKMLIELHEYERDVLYPLATDRIAIDLDDGVLVNYNKFGKAVKEVTGLNDKATKKKVAEFDWIDATQIR